MKAKTITLTITIRPSYADVHHVQQEVDDSLSWLVDEHNAITYEWGHVGEGSWPDEGEDDD